MPTITRTIPGLTLSVTPVDTVDFNPQSGWAYWQPVTFAGGLDLTADVPPGSVCTITAASGSFSWLVTGDGIGQLAAYFAAQATVSEAEPGIIEGGEVWNVPGPGTPYPASDTTPLRTSGTFVVSPITRIVPWVVVVLWRNGSTAFDPATTIEFTLSDLDLTIEYAGPEDGALLPHLELSEATEAQGPIPATATISAEVVDDDEDLFADASVSWALVGAPSEASGFPWSSVLILDPTALETGISFLVYRQGLFSFEITVTAATGEALTGIVNVSIGPAAAPRVESALYVVHFPEVLTVDPVVTDAGWNGPLTYLWEQVGGASAIISSPDERATAFVLPELQGAYLFQLTVSNDLYSGSGLIKIVQAAAVSSAALAGGLLYVTIAGTEYAAGREG